MLADARHDDRALGRRVAQLLQAKLRLEGATGFAVLVGQRELLLPAAHTAAPRAEVGLRRAAGMQVADRLDDLLDDESTVADDRHVGPAHLALLGWIDVDMDDLGFLRERIHAAGDAVVEARTERDQQVGALHRRDGGRGAVHARHAEAQRVIVGERAARHERGDDGDLRHLGEFAQCARRARLQHAAAHVQHGALGAQDQLRGFLDHAGVTLDVGFVAGQRRLHVGVTRPVPRHRVLQDVLGNVHERRARSAGRGQVECLADGERQVVCRHHEFVVLGDAARDAHRVALLEGIGADGRRGHLAGDRHHRDRVHVCVTQRRHQVGGRRTARDHRDAGTTRDMRVALGHVAGTLFVTHEDVADRRLEQRVVGGQDAATGQTEDHLGAFHFERANQGLGARDLLSFSEAIGWVAHLGLRRVSGWWVRCRW